MKERRQYKRSMKSYIPPHDRSGANSSQAHHTTPARGQPSLSLAAGRSHQNMVSQPNNHAQKDANEEASVSLTDTLSKWQQVSKVLIKNYINSHQLHGHADPCLDSPITVGTRPEHCDCTIRQLSRRINGFMMFKRCVFQVEICKHQTLLESLLMCQMMPTSTMYPQSAVHFSLFESMFDNRLNADSSVHGFVKANNASNLRLANFDPNLSLFARTPAIEIMTFY
ncbi:hypothetical protein V8B55DRAFT_1564550 [Mucor lusitanicus]